MRNFLAFVGLVVVLAVGLGYYLGWYKFAMTPGRDGTQHISVDVDTKKATDDLGTGFDKLGQGVKDNLKKEDLPKDDFVGPPEPKPKNFFNMPVAAPTRR